jgi:glycyl-tRNA synthetase
LPELLDNLRLSYDRIEVHGTPRRVAAIVHNLAPQQTDLESEAKGPPADRAFDAEGNPTKAAIGFARGKGVDVSELRVKEDGNRSYVVVSVFEAGRATAEVLGEEMPAFIASLKYERTMRWNHTNISYSRPLRWFVGLFGEQVVPFAYAGIASGKVSRGIRPYDSPDILVENAESYAQTMRDNQIIINNDERQNTILESVTKLATGLGGTIIADANLLDEVTNLVEAPTAFVGSFEEKYLKLPAEALVAVMKKHQRYFPVYAHDDKTLLPYFIAVRNGDNQHLESVQHGNEHVIRARFADADFFYNKDSQKTLEEHRHGLAKLTFQYKLGSMLDKVHRLEKLVPQLANSLGLDREQQKIASRAASLSKADLATNFVVEMTSLQGILGGHYAKKNGESDAVANAIAEQYDAVSSTPASLALALADRLDSLVGLFSAGLAPKGSNDPFALRRAAIHIIENLIGNAVDMDVRPAIRIASDLLPIESTPKHRQAVADFIAGRLEVVLKEKGIKTSVVNAVLAEQSHNPYLASQTVVALQNATEASDWETLLDAYARCVRITRNLDQQYPIRPADFALPAEQALYQAYANAKESADGTLDTFVASLRLLEPAITNFFDDVLVMDEELAVRENRLGLLGEIASLTNGIADLSQLEGF